MNETSIYILPMAQRFWRNGTEQSITDLSKHLRLKIKIELGSGSGSDKPDLLIITLCYHACTPPPSMLVHIRGVSQGFANRGQDKALVAGLRIGTDRSVSCSAKFNHTRARGHTPLDKDALSGHSKAMPRAKQGIQMSVQSRSVAQGG